MSRPLQVVGRAALVPAPCVRQPVRVHRTAAAHTTSWAALAAQPLARAIGAVRCNGNPAAAASFELVVSANASICKLSFFRFYSYEDLL